MFLCFFPTLILTNTPSRSTQGGSSCNHKFRGLSLRANYIDRATAACRRSYCQLLRIEGCCVVSATDPYGRIRIPAGTPTIHIFLLFSSIPIRKDSDSRVNNCYPFLLLSLKLIIDCLRVFGSQVLTVVFIEIDFFSHITAC
jgi:hypothetical protein